MGGEAAVFGQLRIDNGSAGVDENIKPNFHDAGITHERVDFIDAVTAARALFMTGFTWHRGIS